MGRISRRAADELKRTVQIVKGLAPQGSGFADPGRPIRLAKTTAQHDVGVTQDVILKWGEQGAETAGTVERDIVPAHNRYSDLGADAEVLIARVGVGWEILPRSTGGAGASCGSCFYGSGEPTVDLGGGFMAFASYRATLFCENVATIVYTDFDTGVWTGTADLMTVDCNGDTVSWTSTLTYFSHLPGNGVDEGILIEWTDGTNVWKWKNRTSWQPKATGEIELFEGPAECPCAPFIDFTCLIPVASE